MNKLCYLIFMILIFGVCSGQNLVLNGDLESYSGCPSQFSQFGLALDWVDPTYAGSDYFNQCATNSTVTVPSNWMGFQYAHSGAAYGGLYLYLDWAPDYREYIEATLSSSLIADNCYHFEMYMNLANGARYTTDDIGVYFSDDLIHYINSVTVLPYLPQVNNTEGNYADSSSWTLVSGDYIAHGGESYLLIGNFKGDTNTDTMTVHNTSEGQVYVYLDDISLTSCLTGINEGGENESIQVFPNPFTDILNITTTSGESGEVNLFDVALRRIFNHSFTNTTSIHTDQLASGIYFYEVRNKRGVIKIGKVLKD